ncbi:MAG: hypothetical protein ABEK50_14610, partial [bacterium]
WGMLLFPPVLWMCRVLQFSRLQTLMVSWWIAVSSFFVTLSRWIRMYSMFLPVFLTWVICLYKFIEAERTNSRILYGVLSLVLGVFSLHLHLLTISILPAVFIYWLQSKRFEKTFKWSRLLLVGAVLVVVGIPGLMIGKDFLNPGHYLSLNHLYVSYLVYEPMGWILGSVFMGTAVLSSPKREPRGFLLLIIVITLLLMVSLTRRYEAYRYVSHLILLSYFPICWGFFEVLESLGDRGGKLSGILVLGLGFGLPLWEFVLWIPELWNGYMGSLYSHIRIITLLPVVH